MIRRNKSKGHALVLDTGKEEVNAVLSELHDYRFTRLMDPPPLKIVNVFQIVMDT